MLLADETGQVVLSSIRTYGDTIHTFVERGNYSGPFLPGYRAVESDPIARPIGLLHIDHMVGNVGWHEMDEWVKFYANVMGFSLYQHFDDKDISTEYSALMSKVMANGNGYVKFPINEPAEGKKKSQIRRVSRLLSGGPACSTSRWPPTTSCTRSASSTSRAWSSCTFRIPTTRNCKAAWARLTSRSRNLRSWASWSTATTKDTCCRSLRVPWKIGRRCSYEIIQRKGSRSFGKGNFKALFEAIEREQQARGNL